MVHFYVCCRKRMHNMWCVLCCKGDRKGAVVALFLLVVYFVTIHNPLIIWFCSGNGGRRF